MIKVVCYFLPQFHEVKENNLWWGKGYTEWTLIKNAKNYHKDQKLPIIPSLGYYDLTQINDLKNITLIMNEFNIYAMAYYHYWFEGRLILEKPAELLLTNKDINQNFFFFWANHDWKKKYKNSQDILIKQTYGGQNDWLNHYRYLSKFFLDKRYVKLNDKPVIGIYKPFDIPNFNEMISYINGLAIGEGFSGIHVILSSTKDSDDFSNYEHNAIVIRQPDYSINSIPLLVYLFKKLLLKIQRLFSRNFLLSYDYKYINKIIKKTYSKKYEDIIYPGIFTNWDNTFRHGPNGFVIIRKSIKLFRDQISVAKKFLGSNNSDFLFINAWNEWGEGMVLEPDSINGSDLLKVLKDEIV